MINVSQTIKNSCKADTNTHTEYIVINGQTIYIKGRLSATAYKDTTFFGTFNMKVLEFETENSTQFRNREFEYYKVIDGNAFKVGTFITTQVVDNDSSESIKVTANDYALKFAIPYTSQLDYESEQVTLYDVLKECCDNVDVELENEFITNGTFIVDSNQFVNGEMIGDVICAIAGISGNFATITEQDKLRLTFLNGTGETQTTTIDGSSTINASELKDIEIKAKTTQASTPTPSSPQEVKTVTGLQEIKAVGKNLFSSEMELGIIDGTGANVSNDNGIRTKGYIPIEPNTTYYLSNDHNYNQNLYYYDSNFNYVRYSETTGSFTTPSGVTYLRTRTSAGSVQNDLTTKYMLSKGSSASDYEPYIEQVSEINLGKNLLTTNYFRDVATLTINDATNNDFTYYGCWGTDLINNSNLLKILKPNTTYTISFKFKVIERPDSFGQYNTPAICILYGGSPTISFQDERKNTAPLDTWVSTSATFTTPSSLSGYRFLLYNFKDTDNNTTGKIEIAELQIEEGSVATDFAPYFTPIELCKIENYEDKIFKTSGKNLFDDEIELGSINPANGELADSTTRTRSTNFIKVKPNTTYRYTRQVGQNRWVVGYKADKTGITDGNVNYQASALLFLDQGILTGSFTTSSTTEYIKWYDTSSTNINEQVMLSITSAVVDYEPYGYGEWYLKKAIAKRVLNGTENWDVIGDNKYWLAFSDKRGLTSAVANAIYSNYFKATSNAGGTVGIGEMTEGYYTIANYNVFFNYNGTNTDLAGFKTWLSTHNTIVYYVLGTPTYTKLNYILQKQLSDIKTMPLFSGVNNITTTAPFNITYIDNNIEILEDYTDLDDKRDTQPITSVSIGTSQVEGQEAILKDESLIALYGEHWLVLNDNPFAYTLDKRQELVTALFNKVKGFGYSSFTSKYTYRPYLSLGDKIKFRNKAGDLIDSVILRYEMDFDDCTFEAPSITSATIDYEAVPSTEVLARRAEIIANQAEAQISVIATEQNDLEGRVETAEGKLTSAEATLTFIEENTLNEDGSVKSLSTPNTTNTTTYTFDKNGIKIGKSTDDYNSLQDNTGTYYYEKDTMIGKYTKDGSVQKDLALFGKYYYGIDEEGFNVESFTREDALFLAQLYNDGTEEGFGHFYNSNE